MKYPARRVSLRRRPGWRVPAALIFGRGPWAGGILAALAVSVPAARSGEVNPGWRDSAEFSMVVTAGNSESTTLGFKNRLSRVGERWTFFLNAGGVRAESRTGGVKAVDTGMGIRVEEPPKELSAESFFLKGKADRKITDRFLWSGGVGWERNRFTGIENRYTVFGGVGNLWFDREDLRFRTEYAVTYTDQEDVSEVSGSGGTFLGARFSWDYSNAFGGNARYANALVVDGNLDETRDYRADMIQSVFVAMNGRLGLKMSLQWLFDNQPSFREIPLEDPSGAPLGTFPLELDELDTIVTVSLVVDFR